jgi:hypothetical protein
VIPLPQPFLVIPGDGSNPVHIHDRPDWHPPVLAVALVTPYIAQKWLHAGEATYRPVVMVDRDRQILAGRGVVEDTSRVGTDSHIEAAVVELGIPQAETAWTAVQAMRQAFDQPLSTDVDGLVLDEDGGRVLGGAAALYDLRKPCVFLVLITKPNADGRFN